LLIKAAFACCLQTNENDQFQIHLPE
jgi:hypothetical protein